MHNVYARRSGGFGGGHPPAVEMNKNTANFVHNALAERPVFHV